MKRIIALVAVGLFACGGGQAATAPAAASTSSTTSTSGQTAGKLRLGHYSSGDGLVGFVLDRTSKPPKLRMDGSNEVLSLELVRRARDAYDLVNHDKHIGLAIDDDGQVIFSQKGATNHEVVRDGDAQPL